jgi:FHA domain/PilZ domain
MPLILIEFTKSLIEFECMALWHLEGSLDETGVVKRIPITKFPFIIGRSKSIDMVVLRSGISREHAEIIDKDGRPFIRDLQSTNGTFINKQRIQSEVLLTHNTIIHIAQFEFKLIDSEHKSSSDEMLTVVMNVDEALGLHGKFSGEEPGLDSPAPVKKGGRKNKQLELDSIESVSDKIEVPDKQLPPARTEDHGFNSAQVKPGRYHQSDEKVLIQGTWDDSNRRMQSRREVRWPAIVTLRNQQEIHCTTKDISSVGLALTSPTKLKESTLIKVSISTFQKGRNHELTVLGIVKHSLITTGGFIVGVQIKSCTKSSNEFISKFASREI